MEPIRTKGYAQAKGFNPTPAPNTAEQQRRQDEQFMRMFRAVKEAELQQMADETAMVKSLNRKTVDSLRAYNRDEEYYAQRRDQIERERINRQAAVERSVTGKTGSDSKFGDALKLVQDLSETAVSTFQQVDKIQNEAAQKQTDSLIQQAYSEGVKPEEVMRWLTDRVGTEAKDNANQQVGLEQESGIRQMESISPELAAMLRKANGNSRVKGMLTKSYGTMFGKSYAQEQYNILLEDRAQNPDKLYTYQGKEVAIGQLNLQDPDVVRDLLSGGMRSYLSGKGLGDVSPQGLGKFYENSIQGIEQIVGQVRTAENNTFKQEAIDDTATIFKNDPTPINAQQYYITQTQNGVAPAAARQKMLDAAIQLPQDQWEAIGDMSFGPDGKPFREQYNTEWVAAGQRRGQLIEARYNNSQNQRREAELQQRQELQAAVEIDMEDGKFDANPETLRQAAANARMNGMEDLAKDFEKLIPNTANAQYNAQFMQNLESELLRGVVPFSEKQILENSSLDNATKRKALQALKGFNDTAVPTAVSKEDFKEIEVALKGRAKVNEVGGRPANPTLNRVLSKAKNRYRQVYKQELLRTNDPEQARSAALQDFYAEFGTDPLKGKYRVEDPTGPNAATKSGEFIEGRVTGKAYSSDNVIEDIKINMRQNPNAMSEPELFEGETAMLESMVKQTSSGKINVPPVYEFLLSQSGGQMSMRALIEQRLKANQLDPLPENVSTAAQAVEGAFDPRYQRFVNYKPNFTRTDIAAISSGQDPIYQPNLPTDVKNDTAFQAEVSAVAQRLGIREGDLYAIMHFETGGSFNPAQPNMAGSGATGLIQFMPSTAQGLGTSTQALAGMTRVQQMAYVEKYLKNAGVKPGMGLDDLYMSVLFPAAVGKPDSFVLFGRGAMSGYTGRAYSQNAGLDKNGDGSITKAEAAAKVRKSVEPWRQPMNVRPGLEAPQLPQEPQQPQQPQAPVVINPRTTRFKKRAAAQQNFYSNRGGRGLDPKLTGPPAPEAGPMQFIIGDSLAVGATGSGRYNNTPNGNNNSDAQVGRSPQKVLSHLKKYRGLLTNASIKLSTGALNNTANWKDTVIGQLDFLKNEGVDEIRLIGFPNTPKYAQMRKELDALAKQYGLKPPTHYTPGSDGVHPADYTVLRRI